MEEHRHTKMRGKKDQEEEEEKEEIEAQREIWKYVFGFTSMAVVKCAIELGIADTIQKHGGSMTLQHLSSSLKCNQPYLHRIMKYLIHHNIFKETPEGYIQTPLSKMLLKKEENSMADFILLESSPVMLAPWHCLSSRVLANGKAAFEGVHGDDVWSYAEANPQHCSLIDSAMACNARLTVPAVIEGCGKVFEGVESLVDVGGGNGTALKLLVKAFPWIKGINFDLPHVVSAAISSSSTSTSTSTSTLTLQHHQDAATSTIHFVGGDFFKTVPRADAAFLMWVLHDWNDEECIQILKNCKEAVSKDKGKVIIVEAVVDHEKNDELEFARLMLDMVMMAHTNSGKERTSREWDFVLHHAGFTHYTIMPIRALLSVIVAFP